MDACSCGSGRPYDACCGPFLDGRAPAPTAEALMRSRYTAYARGFIDYLVDTQHPKARAGIDRAGVARWSRESEWRGLEVLSTERGAEEDDQGVVEFRARYRERGADRVHHERSNFLREDGRWYYVDGAALRARPAVRAQEVGRNAPCPCKSGKKYKKCCGAG